MRPAFKRIVDELVRFDTAMEQMSMRNYDSYSPIKEGS